ncbi:hypothetical protein FSARC_14942 [Fusarium sarcochroum]|uniref:Peptidase M20 dimerisation domain-containing protein n=1 Tax=Fusarium sarcochroum TaxID=1208366 RepID=A0A8H4SPY8_9HYPO|nr:hypothetical protein FSARC_14942 [Fusarium sarcochroum]
MNHPINFNVAMIEGGDWASSLLAWCRIDCRVALYPGTSADEVAADIEKTIQEASKYDPFLAKSPPHITWNGFFAEGYVLEEGFEAEKILEEVHGHSFQEPVAASQISKGFRQAMLQAPTSSLFNHDMYLRLTRLE